MAESADLVEEYIRLGLALGRHTPGLVDAYYGPPALAREAEAGAPVPPAALVRRAASLVSDLDAERVLEPSRRRWLAAQARGLHTSARVLAGEAMDYLDEVEASYGVRPRFVEEDELAAAHARLAEVLPGTGELASRYVDWREAQVVPPERLADAVASLAEDFRERTRALFGLPEGEHVDFDLVQGEPWAGFNYYLGGLRSRVAINTDLPVLSIGLGHLVAHEAYPGHHTEHTRKEVGLVRARHQEEESIFLVGTPQCLLAEGLADLGLEVIAGRRPEPVLAEHLRALRIPYDADTVGPVAEAGEVLQSVRGNAAILMHARGASADEAAAYIARWSLTTRARAEKAVEFLRSPTWRAYVYCYSEGVALCRRFVAGDPARFDRLLGQQLVPADLAA